MNCLPVPRPSRCLPLALGSLVLLAGSLLARSFVLAGEGPEAPEPPGPKAEGAGPGAAPLAAVEAPPGFLDAKTCFQTNVPYDPRIAVAVDAVIVHRHGDALPSLRSAIASWQKEGYTVGRMFFADSDAGNIYWKGRWDGQPHPEDVERDAAGEVVQCAGVRPYMVPTDGWIRYLEEMAARSIEAGADAILPEEPLAHANTGYEASFRELWERRYGRPWQAEKESAGARFLTAQLKCELYVELERRLAALTRARAAAAGRRVPFVLPVHSIYSNVAAKLVAPLGTSLPIDGIDGYIGQVWTGPVNWALVHYDSSEKSFLLSAYALYDYFVQLSAGTGRRLWLLSDPVEDDPKHSWSEFEEWYRHCVVAKLLFPEVASFEVAPWPDRIFLPGYSTGGGTPAPERFRIAILSAVQVQQEVPAEGRWVAPAGADGVSHGVGVAIADTLLWEAEPFPPLQGTYGMLLPLLRAGVPASACLLERAGDSAYMSRFRTIVLCYEAFKPADPSANRHLAEWVRRGGVLVVIGAAEDIEGAKLWWRDLGHATPLHHLLAELGMSQDAEGDRQVEKGWVLRRLATPRRFGDPATAAGEYLPLVDLALRKAGDAAGLRTPGRLLVRRGPFLAAHASTAPLVLEGKLVDVLDPELPVIEGARLPTGASGLYRDVTDTIWGDTEPRVLHATHRLVDQRSSLGSLRFTVRGPAETPAVARVHAPLGKPRRAAASDAAGREVPVELRDDSITLQVRFPNDPRGVTVTLSWSE